MALTQRVLDGYSAKRPQSSSVPVPGEVTNVDLVTKQVTGAVCRGHLVSHSRLLTRTESSRE
ncbi:MAG: hypothetical protein MI923_22150 [Phycisphaerales bacterium]|nr:hypothetical protein [Phycisphaerales bacterium]